MNLVDDDISRISDPPPLSREHDDRSAGSLLHAHMPALDLLRGTAIVLVVFYHGFFYSNPAFAWHSSWATALFNITGIGWTGVNLFFVLSGFLITGNLADSFDRPNFYPRFYLRRALRILPIYYAVLLLLGLTGFAYFKFLAVCVAFAANVPRLFIRHGTLLAYGPLWSLAVEEQFYLAWPWIFRHLQRRGLLWFCIALIIACPFLRAGALSHLFFTGDIFSKTWMIADNLAIGAFIALLLRSPSVQRAVVVRCALLLTMAAGMGLVWLQLTGHTLKQSALGGSLGLSLLEFFCAGLLVLALNYWRHQSQLPASLRWMVFFSDISYGLYLLHLLSEQIYDRYAGEAYRSSAHALWVRFLIANVAAILVAAISKRFFEDPLIRLKNKIRWAA